jgi:ribose transport system permease protein
LTPADPPSPATTEEKRSRASVLPALRLRDTVVYLGFLAILAIFAVLLHDRGFLTPENLLTIVRQTTPVTVMAVGMTFAMSAGEIDLSIGSVVALAALVGAILLRETILPIAVLASLCVGLVAGVINGALTVRLRIPSLLVTLGTLGIISGLARTITDLSAVPVLNQTFNGIFGSGDVVGLPSLLLWSCAALVIGHCVLMNTAFGRHVLATGGDREAAASQGINTDRIKIAALAISGMTAALAGLLYAGRLHGARYTLGEADLLTVIAAVVIGGTSLFGGKASVIGSVLGSLILGMLNNGLILMGFSVSEQMIARGIILILAVALSLREARS